MNPRLRTLVLTALGAALLGIVACHAPSTSRANHASFDDLPRKQDPAREEDRAARASRRAFYGAPPVVPHEGASGITVADCLECHGESGLLTPHPQFTSCTQCHVATEPPFGEVAVLPDNDFTGLVPPLSFQPAAVETPPPMPHRLTLRENCIACHEPDGMYESLHAPHPERVNCQQCHLPLPGMEFTVPFPETGETGVGGTKPGTSFSQDPQR